MKRLALALCFLACGPGVAKAEALATSSHVFGDWGGVRAQLRDRGVEVLVTYVNELAANSHGGARRDATSADQFMVGADLDLARLAGIDGASVHVTFTDRNGSNLNDGAGLSTLLNPQEIYGYGHGTRLVNLYYQQRLWADRVMVKLGRMPMGGDIFPFSCEFQNLTFCGTVPGFITPNWFTWPVSQWGASADTKLARTVRLETAVYQVNPSFARSREGLDLGNPSGTTGAHAVAQLTWTPSPGGLPGAYRAGVWRNTGDFEDLYRNQAGAPIGEAGGAPRMLTRASGYYLMAEQVVRQQGGDAGRGVTLFGNLIQSDAQVSYVESVWEGGLFWRGPLAARPNDALGLAAGRLRVNARSRLRIAQENARLGVSAPIPGTEYPFEVYYGWAATPAIIVRPNLQYTINPGGVSARKNVVVLGLKTTVDF